MVWNVGDSVEDGTNYDGFRNEYFNPNQPLSSQVPFYTAVGNHEYTYYVEMPLTYDYQEKNGEIYFAYSDLPGNEHQYSFNYGNCHFISIDVNGEGLTGDDCSFGGEFESKLAWLEADLIEAQSNPDIDFIFVFHHHPYKTELWNQLYGGNTLCVGQLIDLYEQYGVNAYFYGHTHAMERGNSKESPVYWIDSSGGGGPLAHWLGSDTSETVSFDWPEIQKAIDEHGFHVVTITAGSNPQFNIKYLSQGDLHEGVYKDNEIIDALTYKTNNIKPDKPVCVYPLSTDNPGYGDIVFAASPFSDTDSGDYHHETHWQVTTVSGVYPAETEPSVLWPPTLPQPTSPVIADVWVRYENIYGETSGGIPIDTQTGDDLTNAEISINWDILNPLNTTYYWRVRYRDGFGLAWSEWSDEVMFSVTP